MKRNTILTTIPKNIRILIISIMCSVCMSVQAQYEYQPFVKEGKTWNMWGSYDRKYRVHVVQPGYEQYLGKEVATIDGIPAKEQAAYVRSRTNLFDAQVQSTGAIQMLTNWSIQYRDNYCDKPAHLTFTDGSSVEVPFLKSNQMKIIQQNNN